MERNSHATTEQVRRVLDSVPARASARDFHAAAETALRSAGFSVEREVLLRLQGRRSFIDLVLDGWFAVELDRRTPRLKSLAKVRAFGAGLVYCRDSAPAS